MIKKNIWEAFMKKVFITLFAVLLTAVLCSCGAVPDRITLSKALRGPYRADIAVSDGDGVYTAVVSYDGDTTSFEFSEPALLCGISYGFTREKSYMIYNDLTIPFDVKNAQDKISTGVTVWKKLLSADGEYTVRRAGEQYVMSDGKTEYRFDAATNLPVCIKSGDITITFTDFKVKNDQTP